MAKVKQNGEGGRIDVTFDGKLAIITMRRGENRFNEQLVEQMNDALDTVLRNPDVTAVVTTGEGRFYSNGLDLDWLSYIAGAEPERFDRFFKVKGYAHLMARLLAFPLPTIALINGHAFAGGAIMAVVHDHVIMQSGRGWWCMNEVHIKLRFNEFLMQCIKAKLPRGETFHNAVIMGKRFTGQEAKSAGIAHQCCAQSDILTTAKDWIKTIIPPNGYDRDHLENMKNDAYKQALGCLDEVGPTSQIKAQL